MRIRGDKLAVSCYALHGDICTNAPHCRALGCASGFWADERTEGGTYPHATSGVMAASEEIADALARDNHRFNKQHFLAVVCGEKDLQSRPRRTR